MNDWLDCYAACYGVELAGSDASDRPQNCSTCSTSLGMWQCFYPLAGPTVVGSRCLLNNN